MSGLAKAKEYITNIFQHHFIASALFTGSALTLVFYLDAVILSLLRGNIVGDFAANLSAVVDAFWSFLFLLPITLLVGIRNWRKLFHYCAGWIFGPIFFIIIRVLIALIVSMTCFWMEDRIDKYVVGALLSFLLALQFFSNFWNVSRKHPKMSEIDNADEKTLG